MLKLREIVWGLFFLLLILQSQSYALEERTLWLGDYDMPNDDWTPYPDILNIHNDVTVTMIGNGGGVSVLNMYDNGKFTMYGPVADIGDLNLYGNATALLYGGRIFSLYVDPASDALVKMYVDEGWFSETPFDAAGVHYTGTMEVTWLGTNEHITIAIRGLDGSAFPEHVQFIPEPATLALLCLGALSIFRKRR